MKNYIFIVLDAVRYDYFNPNKYLGQYWDNVKWYDNVWATSCWTVPSIGSLITGKSPLEHKAMLENNCNLREDIPTIYDYFI